MGILWFLFGIYIFFRMCLESFLGGFWYISLNLVVFLGFVGVILGMFFEIFFSHMYISEGILGDMQRTST